MGKRIDTETIEKIVVLFNAGKGDGEIASEIGVSTSYVNKLRSKYVQAQENVATKKKATKDPEPVYSFVEDTSNIDDIRLLELKVNALERSILWYKELIAFKKKEKKKNK